MGVTAWRVRGFAYDVLGRQTSETWYDNVTDADAGLNARNEIDWTYDLAGRVIQVADDFSFSGYAYDDLDRTTEVLADNPGLPTVVLASEYDRLDGLRSWLKASIGGTADFRTNFAYDAHLRTDWIVQSGQFGGNAVAEKLVDLDYDAADRLTGVTRRAGPSLSSPVVATTTYTPDDQDRIHGITHALAGGTTLEYDLAWDAAGRLAGMTSPDGSVDYGYDDRGQIEAADYDYQTDETYQYDANGNRLTAGGVAWQTDAYNRVTFDGTSRSRFSLSAEWMPTTRSAISGRCRPSNDTKPSARWERACMEARSADTRVTASAAASPHASSSPAAAPTG